MRYIETGVDEPSQSADPSPRTFFRAVAFHLDFWGHQNMFCFSKFKCLDLMSKVMESIISGTFSKYNYRRGHPRTTRGPPLRQQKQPPEGIGARTKIESTKPPQG